MDQSKPTSTELRSSLNRILCGDFCFVAFVIMHFGLKGRSPSVPDLLVYAVRPRSRGRLFFMENSLMPTQLIDRTHPIRNSLRLRRRLPRRRSGFTLMEVLLVLAILVILGSMVTYYFVGAQKKAYARAAQSQIGMFERMMTDYRLDVGTYPTTAQGLEALRTAPTELTNANKWGGPYVSKAIPLDPWGNPYQYELVDADNFRIWSWGPDAQDGTGDEVSNLTQ